LPKGLQGSGKVIQLAKFEQSEPLLFSQIFQNGDFSGVEPMGKQSNGIVHPEGRQWACGLQIGYLSCIDKYRVKQDVPFDFLRTAGLVYCIAGNTDIQVITGRSGRIEREKRGTDVVENLHDSFRSGEENLFRH
jgi:hypothetical protein